MSTPTPVANYRQRSKIHQRPPNRLLLVLAAGLTAIKRIRATPPPCCRPMLFKPTRPPPRHEMLRNFLSGGNYCFEILRNYLSGGNYRRATNAVVVLTTFFLFSRSMKRACIRDLNFIGAEITKNITQNENKAKTNAKPQNP